MASHLYSFGTTFHTHSTSELVSSDVGVGDVPFFSETAFPFSSHTEHNSNLLLFDEPLPSSLDPFSPSFFSCTVQQNDPNLLSSDFGSFSGFDGCEVKNEESQVTSTVEFDYNYSQQFLLPHSYNGGGAENVSKYMQRSFSSNCFERKPGFQFQPQHHDNNTLMDCPQIHRNDIISSPVRRVCSTGDLQNMKGNHMSPTEGQLPEEANFKVGRYSAEERKERISKYRAKRTQRNFNKTIKYACRKTLADNRPRIRGRFARNDEPCEIPSKAACSNKDEDQVDFWMEELRLHEEQDGSSVPVGAAEQYVKSYGVSQFQYGGF